MTPSPLRRYVILNGPYAPIWTLTWALDNLFNPFVHLSANQSFAYPVRNITVPIKGCFYFWPEIFDENIRLGERGIWGTPIIIVNKGGRGGYDELKYLVQYQKPGNYSFPPITITIRRALQFNLCSPFNNQFLPKKLCMALHILIAWNSLGIILLTSISAIQRGFFVQIWSWNIWVFLIPSWSILTSLKRGSTILNKCIQIQYFHLFNNEESPCPPPLKNLNMQALKRFSIWFGNVFSAANISKHNTTLPLFERVKCTHMSQCFDLRKLHIVSQAGVFSANLRT